MRKYLGFVLSLSLGACASSSSPSSGDSTPGKTQTITGTVVDSTNTPIPDAIVDLDETYVREAKTDSHGTFRLASRDPEDAPIIENNYLATGRDKRRMLEAALQTFDPAHGATLTSNPVSSVYGGRMLEPSAIHLWTWDARPYPFFRAHVQRQWEFHTCQKTPERLRLFVPHVRVGWRTEPRSSPGRRASRRARPGRRPSPARAGSP